MRELKYFSVAGQSTICYMGTLSCHVATHLIHWGQDKMEHILLTTLIMHFVEWKCLKFTLKPARVQLKINIDLDDGFQFNTLWLSGGTDWSQYLDKVMACCLMAPSHHLNQHWHYYHRCSDTFTESYFSTHKIYKYKLHLIGANELTSDKLLPEPMVA